MAAFSGTYVLITLFILFPVQCIDNLLIYDIIEALSGLLSFYNDNLKQSNLDGFFGLRIIEGQLQLTVNMLKNGRYSNSDSTLVFKLESLAKAASELVTSTSTLWNQVPNYFGVQKKLLEKPWEVYHPPQLINKALSWQEYPDWKQYEVEAAPTSVENCISEVMQYHPQKSCSLSYSCMNLMLSPKKHGSFLTHQIFYLVIADEFKCLPPLQNYLKVKNRATDTNHVLLEFCTNSYFDLIGVSKVIDEREELQDLFMEIEFMCGHLGFVEFMKTEFLKKILSWQKPSGCYANTLDDRYSKKNKKEIEINIDPLKIPKFKQSPNNSIKDLSLDLNKAEPPKPVPPRFQFLDKSNFENNNIIPAQDKMDVINYKNIPSLNKQLAYNQGMKNYNALLNQQPDFNRDQNKIPSDILINDWQKVQDQSFLPRKQQLNWQPQNVDQMNKNFDLQRFQQARGFDLNLKQNDINQYKLKMLPNNNFEPGKDAFNKILPVDNQFGFVANDFARQNLQDDTKFDSRFQNINQNNFNPESQYNQFKQQGQVPFNQGFQNNHFQQEMANVPQNWVHQQNQFKDLRQNDEYKKRKLLQDIHYDGCLYHKTAMAAGALTAYLRFFFDSGSEDIQQMRIDNPNIDLNLQRSKVVSNQKISFKPKLPDFNQDQNLAVGIPQPGDNIAQHFEHEKAIQKPQNNVNPPDSQENRLGGQDIRNFANELAREPVNMQIKNQQDLRDFANKKIRKEIKNVKYWPKKKKDLHSKNVDNLNYDFPDQAEKNEKKFEDHEYHPEKILPFAKFQNSKQFLHSPKELESNVQKSFIIVCVITGLCLYILFRFIKIRRFAFRYKFSHKV